MSTIKKSMAVLLAIAMFGTVATGFATAVTAERKNSLYDSGLFNSAISESPYRALASNLNIHSSNNSIIMPSVKQRRNELIVGGRIRIANLKQLLAVGSGFSVTDADLDEGSFSSGEQVYYDDGTPARYTASADYYILNDIELNGAAFMLPENFSGSFIGAPKSGRLTAYDEATDTVYIGNIYQLALLNSENRADTPIVSGDIDPDMFGVGSLFFKDGKTVTYSADHNYVLASSFTSEKGDSPAFSYTRDNSSHIDGRDYFGQTWVEIDGTSYILIGDRQQLDAINDNGDIRTRVSGPVYKVYQRRRSLGNWNADNIIEQTETLVYPGDADLIAGVFPEDKNTSVDFSYPNAAVNPMYDGNNGILSSDRYHSLTDILDITGYDRTVYCTVNTNGEPDINERDFPNLTYTKSGKYIVFRDIDMYSEQWAPLMFTGEMYGVKLGEDSPKLWAADHSYINLDTSVKPVIYNLNVNAETLSSNSSKLDLGVQTGVGFFGTLTGNIKGSDLTGSTCIVKNIKLYNGTVTNAATSAGTSQTLVNGLLTVVGTVLGTILDPLLSGLLGKPISLTDTLVGLLNTRAADPASLATGAFAGRVVGKVTVEDCEVESITVSAVKTVCEDTNGDGDIDATDGKIVGVGGFVGHSEGTTNYDLLSGALDTVVNALAYLLNIIPGLGLGDLINVLLDNALPVGDLIPTGYVSPRITNCTVNNGGVSAGEGKYGVGGFAGSLVGTVVKGCKVENSGMAISAHHFGGGFAGVARDGIIKGTLSGLGIDVLAQLHPQTELINCSIENSLISVEGGSYLGGFAGVLANSYCINDDIDALSVISVSGERNYIGGFAGYARLGTLMGLGDFLEEKESLLGAVKDIAVGLLGEGGDQSLLDLGGIANAAILGANIEAPLTVEGGAYVGGIVGRGDGALIASSDETHLRSLAKYKRTRGDEYINALPIASDAARNNTVTQLVSVSSSEDFVGGIAGYLTTANVGGLLGDTLGLAQFLGFEVSHTYIFGFDDETGYTVTAGVYDGENCTSPGDYAGGGIGWAVGGDIKDVELNRLGAIKANNRAGGFVGSTGPGDLANGGGLDLTILGITLLKVNDLLSLFSGVRTTYLRANVTGITEGYTVLETGMVTNQLIRYTAGGYAADANSVRFVDCHANNIMSVTANMHDGIVGGFVAESTAGSAAGLVDEEHTLGGNLLELNKLIDAIPLLVPSYDGCDVNYVDGGFVAGDCAGGFAGSFQSGKVNTYTMETTEISGNTYTGVNPIDDPNTPCDYTAGNATAPWSVNNIHSVRGGNYAGGWGGHVYPGALASAGGGLSLLGAAETSAISATDLLGVADVYIPIIKYAGVNAQNGFTVYAAHDYSDPSSPAEAGYAGGFIGCGRSVQISYSDVNMLAHREPEEPDHLTADDVTAYARIGIKPDELESESGSAYMSWSSSDPNEIPYSVAGARYAGGYIGEMDIGSAASVGDQLSLLGNGIDLGNIVGLLSVVVSTIEHSNVYGAPGGYSVLASSHVNLHDGFFDEDGVGYAGGFAARIAGGHIQDSSSYNFNYIIGEVASGGYVGEMVPGDVANVLPESSLSFIGQTAGLESLAQDFVPSIRNSETTCVPCGGTVRAECFSDRMTTRGMAGGYVGHTVGGQIWGMSNDTWKSENDGYEILSDTFTDNHTIGHYTGPQRRASAQRIRSVYGAEYAGGFCGFMEAGSTESVGSLSLLGGLLEADNLLGTLNAAYATIKRASVTGPLRGLDEATWNAWKTYVGQYGQLVPELLNADFSDLEDFYYGTHVVAGRHIFHNYPNTFLSGCAGGFVGSMHSGVIEASECVDTKLVLAMRAAGGFAGEMQTGDLASVGGISLLGLDLNIGSLAPNLGSVLVPAIKDCESKGYEYGLTVGATGPIASHIHEPDDTIPEDYSFGDPSDACVGCAGGFVGGAYGGQLERTAVLNLKRVKGVHAVGGYAGKADSAALVKASTNNASSGIIQKLLDQVLHSSDGLVDALHATVCTINDATVESVIKRDGSFEPYGFVADGEYEENGETKYAPYAGGFAGHLQATLINTKNRVSSSEVFTSDTEPGTTNVSVRYLRGVNGGHYAGGFVGLASVGSVSQIGGSSTNVLSLLNVGTVDLLDVFRTYIYRSEVFGVDDGILVYSHDWGKLGGQLEDTNVTGAAGGFAGGLMSGTIHDCAVYELNYIEAPNYAGGFVGHSGTKSLLDLSGVAVDGESSLGKLLDLLGLDLSASLQLMNIIGSTFKRDTASGFGGSGDGYIVKTTETQTEESIGVELYHVKGSCAGGFAGYADIAQIEDNCEALKLRKVISPQIAGGFVARSSAAFLGDLEASSDLVGALTWLVRILLGGLGLGKLEYVNLVNLYGDLLGLQLAADGYIIRLNLFGFVVGISLVSYDPETGDPTDVTVVLGSSEITLPIGPDGDVDQANVRVELIELSRTAIRQGLVRGVDDGFDVFGGGASYNADGSGELGYAGGFIGLNDRGFISHSVAELMDSVRGASGKTGPFKGSGHYNQNAQTPEGLEGIENYYYIYRELDADYTAAYTSTGSVIAAAEADASSVSGESFNRYEVEHLEVVDTLADLAGAQERGSAGSRELKAYRSSAKYVGMADAVLKDNLIGMVPMPGEKKDPCEPEPIEITVQKVWNDENDAQHHRPESLSVVIETVEYGAGIPERAVIAGWVPASLRGSIVDTRSIVLTAADADAFSDTWRRVVDDLTYGFYQNGKYYVYYVHEQTPEYYNSAYTVDHASASVKLTNTYWRLPETGAGGEIMYLLTGTALLITSAALAIHIQIKNRRRRHYEEK